MENRWGYGQSIVEFWPISLIFNVVVTLLIGVGSAIGLNSWFRHQSLRLWHLLVVTIWVACGVAMLIQFETQHGPIYGYEEELDERPEVIKRFLYDDEFALDYMALGIVFLAWVCSYSRCRSYRDCSFNDGNERPSRPRSQVQREAGRIPDSSAGGLLAAM